MDFKRGDKVNYKANRSGEQTFAHVMNGSPYGEWKLMDIEGTYIWAIFCHQGVAYVIEHPEGHAKSYFLASNGFKDGFESIHSKLLKDGLTYIYADENELELSN